MEAWALGRSKVARSGAYEIRCGMASRQGKRFGSPVVFVRVGWMEFYGLRTEDKGPVGGGSYNRENWGAESGNFEIANDPRCYGYFQPPHRARGFKLSRIDPSAQGRAVDGALVVIFATDPNHGGQRIVGWYRNARCHDEIQKRGKRSYLFEAGADDCVLVRSWLRIDGPQIPAGKSGTGQANVTYWFDSSHRPQGYKWMKEAVRWIEGYSGPNLLRDIANRSDEAQPAPPSGSRRGSGGESRAHKRLKEYVAENPKVVGLPKRSKATIEHPFASGDCVDIKFDLPGGRAAVVEIATHQPWPGAHQCIKYRALLEAERGDPLNGGKVQAILVAHAFDGETLLFAKRYGIQTVALGPLK